MAFKVKDLVISDPEVDGGCTCTGSTWTSDEIICVGRGDDVDLSLLKQQLQNTNQSEATTTGTTQSPK
jgi:hypothetical protein